MVVWARAQCPSTCTVPGLLFVPPSCSAVTGCVDVTTDAAACDCASDFYKSSTTDTCVACPAGQSKESAGTRPVSSISATDPITGNAVEWTGFQNTCAVDPNAVNPNLVWPPIVGVVVLGLLASALRVGWRRVRAAVIAEIKYGEDLDGRIEEAIIKINELGMSVCYVKFTALKAMGRLLSHEEARDGGHLKVLDTYQQLLHFVKANPTAFFSHQWLAVEEPDPKNTHFTAIIAAAEMLAAKEGTDPDSLYCWVEYAPARPVSICAPTRGRLSLCSLRSAHELHCPNAACVRPVCAVSSPSLRRTRTPSCRPSPPSASSLACAATSSVCARRPSTLIRAWRAISPPTSCVGGAVSSSGRG